MKKITFLAILMASYITNSQIILSEDFETTTIDQGFVNGWTVESEDGTVGEWVVNNPSTETPAYGGNTGIVSTSQGNCTNNYAVVDSDGYGSAGSQDTSLISPVFDLSNFSNIVLSLNQYHRVYQSSIAYIDSSVNNGESWENIVTYDADVAGNTIIDISSLAGNSEVQIRFKYVGSYEYWWAVDDIIIQQPEGSAPDVCTNMSPANEATDVEIVLSNNDLKMIYFSWDAATTGDPATSYNWYFGTTADDVSNLVSNFDGTVENSGITWGDTADTGWQTNTTYYWKVASINPAGSTESSVYSFTTGSTNPLGIEDISVDTFSVSPNPVKDIITINSSTGFDTIKVFNQLGQLIIKSNSKLMDGGRLDLSSLNPGMYLMQIRSDNKSKTVKIIKE
ncbi:MAG: T9SS type A sorting domain-containing protein [Flavobacteriaceae bacterium]|nr:T9SS type A sorting domain-containing protein [Flavobacteriaceae bacterium]